jgi:hypothetical protein
MHEEKVSDQPWNLISAEREESWCGQRHEWDQEKSIAVSEPVACYTFPTLHTCLSRSLTLLMTLSSYLLSEILIDY